MATTPPPIPDDDKDITLRLVLSHVQYHVLRLDNKIEKLIGDLSNDLADFRKEFKDFAHGVDDLDNRVQDIESEDLPKRMKRVEQKVGITA